MYVHLTYFKLGIGNTTMPQIYPTLKIKGHFSIECLQPRIPKLKGYKLDKPLVVDVSVCILYETIK